MNGTNAEMKAGLPWLIIGYAFSLLGGLIGLAIGSHFRNAKITNPDGTKVTKYDASTQKHGTIMCAIAITIMIAGAFAQAMMTA